LLPPRCSYGCCSLNFPAFFPSAFFFDIFLAPANSSKIYSFCVPKSCSPNPPQNTQHHSKKKHNNTQKTTKNNTPKTPHHKYHKKKPKKGCLKTTNKKKKKQTKPKNHFLPKKPHPPLGGWGGGGSACHTAFQHFSPVFFHPFFSRTITLIETLPTRPQNRSFDTSYVPSPANIVVRVSLLPPGHLFVKPRRPRGTFLRPLDVPVGVIQFLFSVYLERSRLFFFISFSSHKCSTSVPPLTNFFTFFFLIAHSQNPVRFSIRGFTLQWNGRL